MKMVLAILFLFISNSYSSDLNYLDHNSLSKDDYQYLTGAYRKYKSVYHKNNLASLANDIPIISVNPHHKVISYILLAQLNNKNIRGSEILHMDSHPDMGFIPSHFEHNKKYISVNELSNQLNEDKINSFQNSLTHISQVILPLVSAGISKNIHMCMPPWFKRIKLNKKEISFKAKVYNKNRFLSAKTHRILPTTSHKNTHLQTVFIHDKKIKDEDAKINFFSCFDNGEISIKNNYILSLDLDILSSNGVAHEHAQPISHHRTNGDYISQKEFKIFKQRMKSVLQVVRVLAQKGVRPKIITIADSSFDGGGDYTPAPLAYLANLYLTQKFTALFNSQTALK